MIDILTHFTFVKNYDEIKNLKEKILKYTKEDWEKYDYRQKNYQVHSNTKTIPLIWNEMDKDNLRNLEKDKRKFWPEADKYKTDLDLLSNILKEKYGKGFIASAMLINLPARSVIRPHVDNYDPYFDKVHRTHLAVVTDDEVIFSVGGEEKNIAEGYKIQDLLELVPNARTMPQIWLDEEHIGGYYELEKKLQDQ